MLVKSTRTEFRMLMSLLVLGLALMALTGCREATAGGGPENAVPYAVATTTDGKFEPIRPRAGA